MTFKALTVWGIWEIFGHKRNMRKKHQKKKISPTNIFEMIIFVTKYSRSTTTLTQGWSNTFRDQIHMGHSATFWLFEFVYMLKLK